MSENQTAARDLDAEAAQAAREIERVAKFLEAEDRVSRRVKLTDFERVLLQLAGMAQTLWQMDVIQGDLKARKLMLDAMAAEDIPRLDHRIDVLIKYLEGAGHIKRSAAELIGTEKEMRRKAAVGGNELADAHSDVAVSRQRMRL